MKIIATYNGEYKDMINSYYNLEKYDDNSTEEVLFQGYSTISRNDLREKYKNYRKRCYMNLEAPCSFTSTVTSINEHNYFTHIYSICPYTCDWLNQMIGNENIPIPFPYNSKSFENINYGEKTHDVIYMGTLINNEHRKIIDVMKNYKYLHTSLFNYPKPYTPTHVNIHSSIKWDLLSKSKVSVGMNLAPIVKTHKNNIRKYVRWSDNEAFSRLVENYIPQFKPRVIESMICKTLVLVKRDWWNVIELWFEPDKHFIYWDDVNDLNEKIREITMNYGNYKHIIDNAYEKVMEYEINKIYTDIIKND